MCYIYPAVFYKEADGRYSVIFPDLNDLATYGNDFADAFTMAQEACGQYLFNELKEGNVLPVASSIEDVIAEEEGRSSIWSTSISRHSSGNMGRSR